MKILVLASWYPDEEKPLNGIYFKEQVEALKENGVDVCVLNIHLDSISNLFRKKKIRFSKCKENNVNIYRVKSYNYFPKVYNGYIRYYAYLLKKYIKEIESIEGRFDLVHVHSAFDAGIAYSISNLDIPYVITEHSSRFHRGVINKSENNLLYSAFLKANKIISVGKGLSEKIQIYCKDKIPVIIPNMVKDVECNNIELDNKRNKFRFFSLAFLNKYKGMDVLIKSFAKNNVLLRECELYIGGNGEELENLKQLSKDLGVERNIKFLGELNREEVNYYMKNSDAFVLASRVETFGIVFIEAMYQGKPVIGTRTGGPDTFINNEVGLTVEVDNIDELSEAMNYIYNNYKQYDNKVIKKYCIDTFSEKVIVEKLNKVYKEVLKLNE